MLCHNPFFKSTVGITKKDFDGAIPFGCGQCLACRINKGRVIKHRLLLEAGTAADSCFVTLTYNDDWKPPGNLLCPPDLQKYMKRIRRAHEPYKFRHYAIGEYGSYPFYRPHYHIALFSNEFIDKQVLEDKWSLKKEPLGFVKTGEITNDSAAYIAGYTTEKLFKDLHDGFIHVLSDEHNGQKEFTTSSRQPPNKGIGYPAIKKLAEVLKNERFFDRKSCIQQLTHGNKVYPLGRYLLGKLQEELGISHADKFKRFFDWQQELLDKHGSKMETPGGFIASIYNESESKRRTQKRRHQIFRKKRRL